MMMIVFVTVTVLQLVLVLNAKAKREQQELGGRKVGGRLGSELGFLRLACCRSQD